MSYSKTFKELDKSQHDRASFDCGEAELNDFIQTQAAKHMQAGISRTMVLPAATPLPNQKYPICSFYTIAPSSICRDTLPQAMGKKLPRYPIPVFLLAQLAVHKEFHGSLTSSEQRLAATPQNPPCQSSSCRCTTESSTLNFCLE